MVRLLGFWGEFLLTFQTSFSFNFNLISLISLASCPSSVFVSACTAALTRPNTPGAAFRAQQALEDGQLIPRHAALVHRVLIDFKN